jgi:hypothetical protein
MPDARLAAIPATADPQVESAAATDVRHWVVPAGADAQIEVWLAPLATEREIADGWKLQDIAVSGEQIRLGVVAPSAADGEQWVELTASEGAVQVHCPVKVPPPVCGRIGEVVRHKPAAELPWRAVVARHAAHTSEPLATSHVPVAPLAVGARPAVVATWLVLLLLLLLAAWRKRVALWTARRKLAQALAVVALGGIAVALLSPHAPLQEAAEMDRATNFFFSEQPTKYGETLAALVLAVDHFVHAGVQTLFVVNAVLATLAVGATLLLTHALFREQPRTLLAGLLLALSPLFLRYAASEQVFSCLILLSGVSLAAWRFWLDVPSPLTLAISVVAAALAMQLRVEWLFFPLAHASLAWVLRARLANRRLALVVAVLALLVLLVPQFLQLAHVLGHAAGSDLHPAGLLPQKVGAAWLLGLWHWSALLVPALAWLAFRARRPSHAAVTRWLLGFYAVLTVVPFVFFSGPGPFAWRMQIVPTALLVPLLAAAPDGLTWLAARWRSLAVALLAVVTLVAHAADVRLVTPPQTEWQFLQQTVPQLPPRALLIAQFGEPPGHFPSYLPWHAGFEWTERDATLPTFDASLPRSDGNHIVYLGLWCWLHDDVAHRAQVNGKRGCKRLREAFTLTPLFEATLAPTAAISQFALPEPGSSYRIGFYRAQARVMR